MAIQLVVFIGSENLAFSIFCNETPPVSLLVFTVEINVAQMENFEQPLSYSDLAILLYQL